MKKDSWIERKEELFFSRFRWLYEERWKKQKKTQADFAEAIAELGEPYENCTDKQVSNWLTGKQYPEKYLQAICTVLRVDQELFSPYGFWEERLYSGAYNSELIESLDQYRKEIGLSDSFFMFLIEQENFAEEFPVNSISSSSFSEEFISIGSPYEITDDFQRTMILSKDDLSFMRELQSEVQEFISFQYQKHRKKLLKAISERIIEEDHRFTPEEAHEIKALLNKENRSVIDFEAMSELRERVLTDAYKASADYAKAKLERGEKLSRPSDQELQEEAHRRIQFREENDLKQLEIQRRLGKTPQEIAELADQWQAKRDQIEADDLENMRREYSKPIYQQNKRENKRKRGGRDNGKH